MLAGSIVLLFFAVDKSFSGIPTYPELTNLKDDHKLCADTPPPPPAGYIWQLVPELSDEFNGLKLDYSKWRPILLHWKGREPSAFDPANISVQDGMLRLRSTTDVLLLDAIKNPEKDLWVKSACVSSVNRSANYGFYAARIKASNLSMSSSFWFSGSYSEIDVVEQFGAPSKKTEKSNLMMMNTHYFAEGWNKDKSNPTSCRMSTGSADSFHVYGVWWKDENTVWMYLDGLKVAELISGGPFREPLCLIFDTEVFVRNGLPSIHSLQDPTKNTMLVDWVRSWKLVKSSTEPLSK